MMTIAGWIQQHGDLDHIDREVLLMDTLKKNRAFILAHPEHRLDDTSAIGLAQGVARLRAGEPLAYVRGHKEFFGLSFTVNQDVLVPRPETELLVELGLQIAGEHDSVLDLGTGTGAIAVSMVHARPTLTMTATDISAEALRVARCNAQAHATRIRFLQGDWFNAVDESFDVIVSNPPYIGADEDALHRLHAEPIGALVSGKDGLDAIRNIVLNARGRCRRALLLEHGASQASAVRALLAEAGFSDIRTVQDLAGHDRVTWGLLS